MRDEIWELRDRLVRIREEVAEARGTFLELSDRELSEVDRARRNSQAALSSIKELRGAFERNKSRLELLKQRGAAIPPEILSHVKDVDERLAEQEARRYLKFSELGALRDLIATRSKECRPPRNGELFIYLFLPEAEADAIIGDLDGRFAKLTKRLGVRRAKWWYRKQIFSSLWPLAKDAIRRAKSSSVLGILRFALRLVGQGALADQLKRLDATGRRKERS